MDVLDPYLPDLIPAAIVVFVGFMIAGTIRGWVRANAAVEAHVFSGFGEKDPVVISLRSRQVSMTTSAQSKDNVTLRVDAVAIVKVGSDPELVRRAAERFASQDEAVEQFATEQLDGALRGVVATLTVIELMRERQAFSRQIAKDVSTDLAEQGLILDSFQIKGITVYDSCTQSLGAPLVGAAPSRRGGRGKR